MEAKSILHTGGLFVLMAFAFLTVMGNAGELRSAQSPSAQELFISPLFQDTTTFTDIVANLLGGYFSSVVWGDYDNDGDLDLLVNGATDDDSCFTRIYRNDNGTFVDINAPLIGVQSAHSESWVDYDNDGDLDLVIQGATGVNNYQPVTKIYRNDSGNFVDINAGIIGLVYGSTSWGDYDNDGDLDLLITGSPDGGYTFVSRIYRNDSGTFVDVQAGLPGVWGSASCWVDYNGDGLLDVYLTGYGDRGVTNAIFRNDKDSLTDIHAPLVPVDHAAAAWGDFDNDGDQDLLLTGLIVGGGGTYTTIYRNDGGNFVDISPGLVNVMAGAVAVGDYDNDGWVDILISGAKNFVPGFEKLSARERMILLSHGGGPYITDPVTKVYRNEGGTFVDIGAELPGLHNCAVAWGDFDNDGDLDIALTGGTSQTTEHKPFYPVTRIYRNNRGLNRFSQNTAPSIPQGLSATVHGDSATLTWTKSTDDHTPQSGLYYNMELGFLPRGVEVISPISNSVTGFQRVPKFWNAHQKNQWVVKNLPEGTYYWGIQAMDRSFAGSSFSQPASFTIGSSGGTVQWKLVSVTGHVSDSSVTALFPMAVSHAFGFNGNYFVCDHLRSGAGYWLKLPVDYAVHPMGEVSSVDTINVMPGWNMIGSITNAVPISAMVSQPAGIVVSGYFGYESAYFFTDTIVPGRGYWVKTSQPGKLILDAVTPPTAGPQELPFYGMNALFVRDARGQSQTLYYGMRNGTSERDLYSLPPTPPEGCFDARFASDKMALLVGWNQTSHLPLVFSSASYPITIRWNAASGLETANLIADGREVSLGNASSIQVSDPSVKLDLFITGLGEQPAQYILEQNYPNPFNPLTEIVFGLPQASIITLEIFNILGQEVASLANREKMAEGFHRVRFEGKDLSSGIYLYRLEVENIGTGRIMYTQVKKMTLMR